MGPGGPDPAAPGSPSHCPAGPAGLGRPGTLGTVPGAASGADPAAGRRDLLSLERSCGNTQWAGLQMTTTFETRHTGTPAATLGDMATVQAVTPRTRYESRPGRGVVVAATLADLQGPTHGQVELPIWLFWHPGRTFDLDKPGMLPWMCEVVLREARSTEDLAHLNGEMLAVLWPDLYLPKGVRQAWEDQHPELHAAPAPAA